MPWSIGDVDKFNKGLNPSQKAKWVSIANSVLEECKDMGGKVPQCESFAIKQANSMVQMNHEFNLYGFTINSYSVERKMHSGRQHLVLPVIMMVEGVHAGSHGPLFHSIDELGKYPKAWDGIPICIGHPYKDNLPTSANCPEVIDTSAIGRVYGSYVDGNQLKGYAWVDESKLFNYPELQKAINNKIPIEVSLGMFTDEEYSEGVWNSETYTGIARNPRPDHLAILLDGQGACSVKDGCGIRINKKEDSKMAEVEKCCPEKVQLLIQNEVFPFVEADREKLELFPEEIVDKLIGTYQEIEDGRKMMEEAIEQLKGDLEKVKGEKDKIQTNSDTVTSRLEEIEKKLGTDKVMELLPKEVRQSVDMGLRFYEVTKTNYVEKIKAHTSVYSDEELKAMDVDSLDKLGRALQVNVDTDIVDYSFRQGSVRRSPSAGDEEVLMPVIM